MSKKVVFVLISGGRFTGGPRVLVNLLSGLDRNVICPSVVTQGPSPMVDALLKIDIEVSYINLPKQLVDGGEVAYNGSLRDRIIAIYGSLSFNFKLYWHLRAIRAQCIWVRNSKGVLLVGLAAMALRMPLIWDIGMEKSYQGFMRFVHDYCLRIATLIVAEARSVYKNLYTNEILKRFSDKFKVIPSGVSPHRVNEITAIPKQRESKTFVILSVGTLCDRKNQMMLLEAMSEVIKVRDDVFLRIVGEVSELGYHDQLSTYVLKAGLSNFVEFLGWRDDIPHLMRTSDCLVITSKNEGVPYVLLEALHAEIPVISTPAGGVGDLIRTGVEGYLVDYSDSISLAECIKKLIDVPEEALKMVTRGRQLVDEVYNHANWIKNYERLLVNVLKK